jgi:hypothetical protein
VFENMILRRIFGMRRDEEIKGWRTVHNEELHGFYSLSSITRVVSQEE